MVQGVFLFMERFFSEGDLSGFGEACRLACIALSLDSKWVSFACILRFPTVFTSKWTVNGWFPTVSEVGQVILITLHMKWRQRTYEFYSRRRGFRN